MDSGNYTCSRCGASVTKITTVCPNCHATLRGITCAQCHYTGNGSEFVGDRCPKCHAVVKNDNPYGIPPFDSPREVSSSTTEGKKCPICGQRRNGDSCEYCGNMNWLYFSIYLVLALGLTYLPIYFNNTVSKSTGSGVLNIAIAGLFAAAFWFFIIRNLIRWILNIKSRK
jgi:hypothetical protein